MAAGDYHYSVVSQYGFVYCCFSRKYDLIHWLSLNVNKIHKGSDVWRVREYDQNITILGNASEYYEGQTN